MVCCACVIFTPTALSVGRWKLTPAYVPVLCAHVSMCGEVDMVGCMGVFGRLLTRGIEQEKLS